MMTVSNTFTKLQATSQNFKRLPLITGLLLAIPFSTNILAAKPVKPPAPKPVYKTRINDTGITTCSNDFINGLRCPINGYPGQDAQYGRDKSANNKTNGHAGFSFYKISSSGKPLPAGAPVWDCVKDNVTGLLWESKTDDGGLHDMDWTYSWYNPDTSTQGGGPGQQNSGNCFNGTGCDTDSYVKIVNQEGWCGQKDWRLPTRIELTGLATLDRTNSALDQSYFPKPINADVWSSSPYAGQDGIAWAVDFSDGNDYASYKSGKKKVWLVSGGGQ